MPIDDNVNPDPNAGEPLSDKDESLEDADGHVGERAGDPLGEQDEASGD